MYVNAAASMAGGVSVISLARFLFSSSTAEVCFLNIKQTLWKEVCQSHVWRAGLLKFFQDNPKPKATLEPFQGPVRHATGHSILLKIIKCQLLVIQLSWKMLRHT
jgi:hypothetical protein